VTTSLTQGGWPKLIASPLPTAIAILGLVILLISVITPRSAANFERSGKFVRQQRFVIRY
jgi:hypothetical protein